MIRFRASGGKTGQGMREVEIATDGTRCLITGRKRALTTSRHTSTAPDVVVAVACRQLEAAWKLGQIHTRGFMPRQGRAGPHVVSCQLEVKVGTHSAAKRTWSWHTPLLNQAAIDPLLNELTRLSQANLQPSPF